MPNLIVSAVSTFDNKGLKKGSKEVSAFEKQVKSFGKVFAGVFSATALLNYSKKAVQAFADDERAAKALEIQLRNTGFAFAAPAVEDYIANLQRTTGVLDDQLRPAFQQLLTVTGSVSKSQEALNTALNISAATGKSVTEVSAALTRGYSGNTTGLSRLGAGISKATLKAGKMEDILAELNQKFAGQAAARLDTYAGKMDLLKVAAADASEIIGKGLLDSLALLGKDKNIENVSNAMTELATDIADITLGISLLISKFTGLLESLGLKNISIKMLYGPLATILKQLGETERTGTRPDNAQGRASARIFGQQLRLENKLSAQKKLELAILDAKNKKQTEVDKLSEKFDTERIALMKALGEATDDETKLRIQAKLAILDNNEALAKKYNAELEASSASKLLAEAFNQTTTAIRNFGPALFDALGNITGRGRSQLAPLEGQSFNYTVPQGVTNQGAMGATAAPIVVNVPVNAGTIVTNQELQGLITDTVRTALKSGNKLLPAGGIS